MKTNNNKKLYGTLLTVLAALVLTGSFSVSAQAKTKKPYKTKTIKVVEGKSKTYAKNNKIKKVKKVSKNKAFSVKILSGKYRIKVSGTDRGKKQTIKNLLQKRQNSESQPQNRGQLSEQNQS